MNATDSEKDSLKSNYKEALSTVELTVWLKDFPKTAADFKECRQSADFYHPYFDFYIHAGIMIEE